MPTVTPADALITVADNLTTALAGDIPQSDASKESIDRFMELFTENAVKYQEENVKRQRVLNSLTGNGVDIRHLKKALRGD